MTSARLPFTTTDRARTTVSTTPAAPAETTVEIALFWGMTAPGDRSLTRPGKPGRRTAATATCHGGGAGGHPVGVSTAGRFSDGVFLMSASSEPAPSPPFTQNREFWVLMGYAVALGVFGAFAGLVFMGVIGFGGRWYADAESGLVRRAVVVGGGHRGRRCRRRAVAPPDAPARGDSRPDPRSAGGARRPAVGAGDRGRLGGVADRRRQPGPGEGPGRPGRRRRQLDRPTTQAQPGRRAAVHLVRFRRRVRRAVLQHGDRGDVHPGARSPRWPPVRQGPRRRRSWPRASRSGSTSPSPARCSWTPTRCRSTRSRTGSCWRGSRWACSRPSW